MALLPALKQIVDLYNAIEDEEDRENVLSTLDDIDRVSVIAALYKQLDPEDGKKVVSTLCGIIESEENEWETEFDTKCQDTLKRYKQSGMDDKIIAIAACAFKIRKENCKKKTKNG